MNITIDKNVVSFKPESPHETSSMETLWRIIIDCIGDSKKLTPIGEYIPVKDNTANFMVEGVPGGKTVLSEQTSTTDGTVICYVCNKYMNVKSGEALPYCCGKIMEAVD